MEYHALPRQSLTPATPAGASKSFGQKLGDLIVRINQFLEKCFTQIGLFFTKVKNRAQSILQKGLEAMLNRVGNPNLEKIRTLETQLKAERQWTADLAGIVNGKGAPAAVPTSIPANPSTPPAVPDLAALKLKMAQKESDLAKAQGDVATLQGDIVQLKGQLQTLSAPQQKIAKLETDLMFEKAKSTNLEQEVGRLSDVIAQLKTGVNRGTNALASSNIGGGSTSQPSSQPPSQT